MENTNFIENYNKIPYDRVMERIEKAKNKLNKNLIILGHHYQREDVIKFADKTGDSLELAQEAENIQNIQYVVFCGVHFMAEGTDILTNDNVKVIIPDIKAGCPLADMGKIKDIEKAWEKIKQNTNEKIIPITYINSGAELKAFVGKNGGSICTSGNAEKIIKWALNEGDKIFFFPDQHLGRNTSYKLNIPLNGILDWDKKWNKEDNFSLKENLKKAKIILWYGYCNVHQFFTTIDIDFWKKDKPNIKIIVHPECEFEVAERSDYVGSTSFIIKKIQEAHKESEWAIGTENNLVERLAKNYPHLFITNLGRDKPICKTMSSITPIKLLYVLENLVEGNIVNQIKVEDEIAKWSKVALTKMLDITKNN